MKNQQIKKVISTQTSEENMTIYVQKLKRCSIEDQGNR